MNVAAPVRNALDEALAADRAARRLSLLMYLTAGFPDAASTARWGPLLEAGGASIIELGVPFSDPLGDGPTIQRSSQAALNAGMTLRGSLELAASIARRVAIPVVIMSYCNPIFRMGVGDFARRAAEAGVTGVIVPDLPIEEAGDLASALAAHGVHPIYLLSPASTAERIARTAEVASGFIYCMAVTGVTGARARLAEGLPEFLARVRTLTDVPLVVGFGVSRPEHLRALAGIADGAVVASALVDLIERTAPEGRAQAIEGFVKELSAACSGS
jgi:tryptophan synthase alpha chain